MTTAPRGHIKLARKAFDPTHGDPFWLEPRRYSKWEAWVDVLQLASWKRRELSTKYGIVTLERGEVLLSMRHAAERWGWSKRAAESWVDSVLKGGRMEGRKAGRIGTVYRIVNYDTYQSSTPETGTQDGAESGTQAGRKRDKKEAVKQELPKNDADASFPAEHYDRLEDEWCARFGVVSKLHFRKGIKDAFRLGIRPGQLVRAFGVYADEPGKKKFQWFLEDIQSRVKEGDSCALEHAPCEVFGMTQAQADAMIAEHHATLARNDETGWMPQLRRAA